MPPLSADTGEASKEMEACESGWGSAPLKQRSKRRSMLTMEVGGKAGRLAGQPSAAENRAALSDSSDSEGCVSDSSDLSHSQQAAVQVYTANVLKYFLQQTKGMRKPVLERYFPDMQGFYNSARYNVKHRAESELTDQEVFRLEKLIIKVRKQFLMMVNVQILLYLFH